MESFCDPPHCPKFKLAMRAPFFSYSFLTLFFVICKYILIEVAENTYYSGLSLSRTSLFVELMSRSLCVGCILFFSLYLELSLSRTNSLVPCEFEIERVNCSTTTTIMHLTFWIILYNKENISTC